MLNRTARTGPSCPLRQCVSLLGSFSLGGSKDPGAGAGPSGLERLGMLCWL